MQVGDGRDVIEETDVHENEREDEALATLVAEQDGGGVDTKFNIVSGILG